MAKKHEKIYRSYKRNHEGGDFREKETAKVKNDRRRLQKSRKKTDRMVERMIHDGIMDDESMEALDELMVRENKDRGGYKAHKNRLQELEKNEDF